MNKTDERLEEIQDRIKYPFSKLLTEMWRADEIVDDEQIKNEVKLLESDIRFLLKIVKSTRPKQNTLENSTESSPNREEETR